MKDKNKKITKFIKVVYFDESTAQDYIDILHEGRFDRSVEQNNGHAEDISAQVEAQGSSGMKILKFLKANFSGEVRGNFSGEISKMIDTTLKNTLLTDYLSQADKDDGVRKFPGAKVYAPENSLTLYRMYHSYFTIVPKDKLPIDMEKLNEAVLGERGYYPMLMECEENKQCVLRFNIGSFRNNYNLADLSKMELTYYGVKVGNCTKEQLSIEQEFESTNANWTASNVVNHTEPQNDLLEVYDVVLAGIIRG